MQAAQRMTLANGLRVNLIHDRDASRAAALIQLAAGSHDGPQQWPGLAHLLEHVLFAGSERYQEEQRLMAWGPANGARLNATTLAHHTAWFFDIASDKFSQGLLRLTDMLACPLLNQTSVRQEAAVIDAEFQMLTRHTDTLCEAALSQAFATPHPLHAFHVGNRAAFGEEHAVLQQALQAYHQRFFRAEKLELWLQGPQSVEALAELAEEVGAVFSSSPAEKSPEAPPLILTPQRHFGLHIATAERLQLSAAVAETHREILPVLRELLMDSAEGSFLATLRELGLADDIVLLEPYRAPRQTVISVQFALCATESAPDMRNALASPAEATPAAVEALFNRWLQQVAGLNEDRLRHYATLARRRFTQLSALDQLRARAFGFVPPVQDAPLAKRWQVLMSELEPEKLTALWISSRVEASPVQIQGFMLHTGAIGWPSASLSNVPEMAFYAAGKRSRLPALPVEKAPLMHFPAACQPLLLLSPSARFSQQSAALVAVALQPVIGLCLHQGGDLNFAQRQGIWLLQLSAPPDQLPILLAAVIDALTLRSPQIVLQGMRRYRQTLQSREADIAIRVLLARLPELIASACEAVPSAGSAIGNSQPATVSQAAVPASYGEHGSEAILSLAAEPWQAALYGGNTALQEATSRLLSRWPGGGISLSAPHMSLKKAQPALARKAGTASAFAPMHDAQPQPATVPPPQAESAVLLFCPLIDFTAECLAAWQLLAAIYEPKFFQRLRVELNIGYVVSCRYHQSVGQSGLLFALQSPVLTGDELKQHIVNFICEMTEVVADVTEEALRKKSADLIADLPGQHRKTAAHCLTHWEQLNLPAVASSVFAAFSPETLHHYARRLATERAGWIWAH